MISNNKLLETPEFKYCAFKDLLLKAFNLSDVNNIMLENMKLKKLEELGSLAIEEEVSELFNDELRKERDDELLDSQQQYVQMKLFEKENKMNNYLDIAETGEHVLILKDNQNMEINKAEKEENIKVEVNRRPRSQAKEYDNNIHHIDFNAYCNIMKLFNVKYPVDCKISCNYL
jgi:hypothetical protein